MLPKENRLTKNKEFDFAFKQGKSNYNKTFGLKMAPNNLDITRMGILLGNKVSKRATDRNRIKRQLREAFGSEMEHLIQGNDFVIVVLPEIVGSDFASIKTLLQMTLKKIGAYKRNV